MPKKILIAALVAVVCGCFGAPGALAGQAYRYWESSTPTNWKGSRVTVDNPTASQMSIQSPNDFDLTSAYADDGGFGCCNLIQIGVTYEWQDPEPQGTCNLGSPSAALYYFVEIEQNGSYTCYNLGYASGGAQNLMSTQRGSDNLWHAYKNGVGAGVSNSWTPCNGNSCRIAAFAENANNMTGYYYAKYAGTNQTPWQYYNGSSWSTITSTPNPPLHDLGWDAPTGPFPGGIWSFYHHIP
jgi:hypothetical protein